MTDEVPIIPWPICLANVCCILQLYVAAPVICPISFIASSSSYHKHAPIYVISSVLGSIGDQRSVIKDIRICICTRPLIAPL